MNAPDHRAEAAAVATDYAILGGSDSARGRKLFATGAVLLAAALGYLVSVADVQDSAHLYLGLLIFVLAFVPALQWARSGGSRFPVFETILGLCAPAYALPVLKGHEQLFLYAPQVVTRACFAVLLYQVTAIVIYRVVRGTPGQGRFWRESLISERFERLMVWGLTLSTIYMGISVLTTWIPSTVESVLRAVFFGVSILCTFVGAQRWGRGELSPTEKAVMLVTIVPQLVFMSLGLILIAAICQLGIALLGYLSGGKRIPWLAVIIAFPLLAVLHTGKTRMRQKYWDNAAPPPTASQVPAYFAEWIEYGLQPTSGEKTVSQKMLERTSLMHLLCLIINVTPERQDYLYGSTYRHVLPQLIPRIFWPEKPRSHVATYELAIYYGLQREEDTNTTTIAFGLVAEAYANFGLLGAALLGAFWGFILKKLQIWSTYSPMFSFAGLLMVLLTAWSFNSELTMAAWVSSFEQAVLVVLGAPFVVRSLLGF